MATAVSRLLKRSVKGVFRALGVEVTRYRPQPPVERPPDPVVQLLTTHGIDTVFDVGANIGQYASRLRSGGFNGRIVSFEPLTEAHAMLADNASQDPLWTVASAMALGGVDYQSEIYVASNLQSSSILEMTQLHEKAAPGWTYVGKETVQVHRLDSVFEQYIGDSTRPFLKIDAQGYESQVLDGADSCLQKFIGIQAEMSLRELYRGQTLWLELALTLQQEGFELAALFPAFTDLRTGCMLQVDGLFFRELAQRHSAQRLIAKTGVAEL